ncbi:MAG: GAF domain-containing protein [Vicinamibacteria bacterium]|nr:GAF domain-containing protein [Vicinamibacteria bacterium]
MFQGLSLAAAAVSLALCVHAWRRRTAAPGAGAFALLMAAASLWAATAFLQRFESEAPRRLAWLFVGSPGVFAVPPAWLLFSLQFTGREARARAWRVALFVVPSLSVLAVLCDVLGVGPGLYLRAVSQPTGPDGVLDLRLYPGPWYWVNITYSYLCLAAGSLLLLPHAVGGGRPFRSQAAALLVGTALPWLLNVYYVTGPRPLRGDFTHVAIALSGIAFSWAIFRWRLLDLAPVAREALIEGWSDGMLALDLRLRIVDTNPAACAVLGLDAEQVLGADALPLLERWPALAAACRGGGEATESIELDTAAGRRHYDVRFSPLRDARGRERGRLLVFADATRQRQAEAELVERRWLLESLLAVARAVSEQPSLQGTLQNALDTLTALTRADSASLILLTPEGRVHDQVVVSRAALMPSYVQDFAEPVMRDGLGGHVARSREPALVVDTRLDTRWTSLPGGADMRSALAVPILSAGRAVGVLTLTHSEPGHFTTRQLELVRAAAETIALGVRNAQMYEDSARQARRQTLLYDLLRAMSEEQEPHAGARRAADLIASRTGWRAVGVALRADDGAGFVLLTPDGETEWPDAERGIVGRALRTGLVQRVADVLADPDYVVLWRDARSELAMPVRHGERVLGVLNFESERVAAFDDEDVRLAESLAGALGLALAKALLYRDLERQHQKLRQAERLRDDLTHALVHDIKSPLTTVLGSLGFLEDKLREGVPADPRLVEMALRGGTRIRELVDGLLDVGRLEAGQMALDLRAHEVAPLVAEALRLQAPLAEKRGIAVESRLPPQPLHAVLDAELFARVLQNLVGNALKFTPQGGSVWVAARPRDGVGVEIEIGDTGPGIPADLRPRLFQKFAASGPGHGTGLGLAFCRLAVEAHEGTLELRRREGAGAVFAFTLRSAPGPD